MGNASRCNWAEVIGQNLKGSSGEVKVLIPGRRMSAVFGLAKLKYFAIITEVRVKHHQRPINSCTKMTEGTNLVTTITMTTQTSPKPRYRHYQSLGNAYHSDTDTP